MISNHFISLELWEILGVLGALIYAGSYLLVALDRLTSWSPVYYGCKLAAALLVLSSLWYSFNLAATLIQVFFVLVSILGLYRHISLRRVRGAGAPLPAAPQR